MSRGSPASQQTKTLTVTRIGGANDDKSSIWGIFTSHHVAKLLSLFLAVLLVFLIDREIEIEIFDGKVTITEPGAGNKKDHLEVILPNGFILMNPQGSASVRITIEGNKRDEEELEHPFRAIIPDDRVQAIFNDKSGENSVPLEAADIRIAGVATKDITIGGDASVLVSKRKQWTCQLKALDQRTDKSKKLEVEFSLPRITVSGPEDLADEFGSLAIPVRSLINDAPITPMIMEVLATWHRSMRLESKEFLSMTAKAPESKTDTIVIPSVPILFVQAPDSEFEFKYLLHSPEVQQLKLTGPLGKVAQLKNSKAELERLTKELRFHAEVELAAQNMGSVITSDQWWTLSDVELRIPDHLLSPWELTPAPQGLGSHFQARRLKAKKKEN